MEDVKIPKSPHATFKTISESKSTVSAFEDKINISPACV